MDLLNGMRVFVRVVESGRFTAAAHSLDLSNAQVSRLVADLEAHLQARLLQRTTRRLMLTESGERFLLRCRQILGEVAEATIEARGAHLKPSGRLRIHCMNGLGILITPLIAKYSEVYPEVLFDLTLSQHNPDPLEEGHDVVISVAQTLADSQMVALPIGRFYSMPCASPAYLAEHGAPDHPRQLEAHRCLHLQDFFHDGWLFRGEEGEYMMTPGEGFRCNVAESVAKASQAGMGVSLLPFYTATQFLQEGRLKRLLPRYRLREREIHAVYPSRRFLDAKVRTWVDFLKIELPLMFAEHERVADDPQCWAVRS